MSRMLTDVELYGQTARPGDDLLSRAIRAAVDFLAGSL